MCDGALGRILTFMSLGRLLPSTALACSAHQAQRALTHISAGHCRLISLSSPSAKAQALYRLWFDIATSHLCVGKQTKTNYKMKKSKVSHHGEISFKVSRSCYISFIPFFEEDWICGGWTTSIKVLGIYRQLRWQRTGIITERWKLKTCLHNSPSMKHMVL